MGVFILALIAVAVYAVMSTPVPTSIATDAVSSTVANPELRLATRYADALANAAQSPIRSCWSLAGTRLQ